MAACWSLQPSPFPQEPPSEQCRPDPAPAPEVEETLDFEAILAKRKAILISYYPADQQAAIAATLELESEPLNKLLQENAYNEMILRARINDAAK